MEKSIYIHLTLNKSFFIYFLAYFWQQTFFLGRKVLTKKYKQISGQVKIIII